MSSIPSKTQAQRKLMGAALSAKRGSGCSKATGKVKAVCKGMTQQQLRDFARKGK